MAICDLMMTDVGSLASLTLSYPPSVIKGTGSRLGACALIILLFPDLLVILLVFNPLTCISAITYYSKSK